MDNDIKNLLQKNLELAQDNNKLLHSMRRNMRFSHLTTLLYWALIIGSFIGAYYYLEPFIKVITQGNSQIQKSLQNILSASKGGQISPELQNLLNKLGPPPTQ